MQHQYILPINKSKMDFNPHDFIFTSCNIQLQPIIDALPQSKGVKPYPNIMLITGPKKSGKTHFAHLFAENTHATWLTASPQSPYDLVGQYFVIDDIDKFHDEALLLHLFNYFCETNKIALFTSTNSTNFHLKDLSSRLSATSNFMIHMPDDIMVKTLLSKHLASRMLNVSDDVIKFAINRIPRNYEAISNFVEFIDQLSLKQKRNINLHFLSSLYN